MSIDLQRQLLHGDVSHQRQTHGAEPTNVLAVQELLVWEAVCHSAIMYCMFVY